MNYEDILTNNLLVNKERETAEKYNYEDILPHFMGAKRGRAHLVIKYIGP